MNNILLLSFACGIVAAVIIYLRTGKFAHLAERPKLRLGICAAVAVCVFALCLQTLVAVVFVVQAAVVLAVLGGITYLVLRVRQRMRR